MGLMTGELFLFEPPLELAQMCVTKARGINYKESKTSVFVSVIFFRFEVSCIIVYYMTRATAVRFKFSTSLLHDEGIASSVL